MKTMDELLAALRAVAEPTRLRLAVLSARGGELTVSELTQILGQSQPRVSRHLKLLCEAGVLERFREGSWVFYRLVRTGPVAGLVSGLATDCDDADATLALDLQRLAATKEQRAAQAAAYFRANAAQWHRIRALYVDEREVEAALVEVIDKAKPADLLDIAPAPDAFSRCSPRGSGRRWASTCRARCWRWRGSISNAPASPMPGSDAATCISWRWPTDPSMPSSSTRSCIMPTGRRRPSPRRHGCCARAAFWWWSILRRITSNFCAPSMPIAASALPMTRLSIGAAMPVSNQPGRGCCPETR